MRSKNELLFDGQLLINDWCKLNGISQPGVEIYWDGEPTFGVCAYYRENVIHIWPKACAGIGMAGKAYSYPGYIVDRTPYGVLAHELGHHVDDAAGRRGGNLAHTWRKETQEEPITSYADNDNEWFAEIFRLYVTNPDLLSKIRKKMFNKLHETWPWLAEKRLWEDILKPVSRQYKAAENKIKQAKKSYSKQLSLLNA